MSRAGLLRRGGALLLSGSAMSAFVGSAGAATIPDSDLAYLRLLIGAELLAVDSQTQALASGRLSPKSATLLKRMLADEKAHYGGLANLLAGTGQIPATADDINFAYAKGSFDSETSIMKLAAKLEDLTLGAYLGAVANVQTSELRLPIGQIAANEAQHQSALAAASGRPPIGRAFGPALQIAAVSAALDAYES
ncbi:MAG TPA: ferritin-like domain-containing protein [Gaiellaceae bacterium]|nr:ferritin-like domain-containing protein [Gaiellaceae bacterium]